MKRSLVVLSILFALSLAQASTMGNPPTLRVDYFHTGNATTEMFSLDRFVREPLPWPGSMKLEARIDNTNLGKYFFEVRDKASSELLFSRGFSSIYGEWETTGEAKQLNRSFNESFRFPDFGKPVHITLSKRDARNAWQKIWELDVDPKSMFVDSSKLPSAGALIKIRENGSPSEKVDFLILGDGYTAKERSKCDADARRLTRILFSTSPFKEHEKDFNVWALCPAAMESGISRPSTGVYRRSPVGATYDAFGSERYVLTFDNHAFRDIASQAPYEFVEVLTNTSTYGGGGIFGLYSTVAADSAFAPYVFVHEFGHHFAGLADEYYTSDVAYEPSATPIEPWEPNATALLDPKLLKWREMVAADTPIPTPWPKSEFEQYSRSIQEKRRQIRKENRPETEMNALFTAEREHEEQLLASGKYANAVGAFEGANYEAKGYYRPQANCIMFTRTQHFCRVCQGAVEKVIRLYTAP